MIVRPGEYLDHTREIRTIVDKSTPTSGSSRTRSRDESRREGESDAGRSRTLEIGRRRKIDATAGAWFEVAKRVSDMDSSSTGRPWVSPGRYIHPSESP